jgi:O-antigen/teichoic acid export membrane protein
VSLDGGALQEYDSDGSIHDEQRQYLSKVTREAGFAFSGKIFGLIFGFVAQATFARLLGADLLGVFVLAWTVVYGVTILTTFGFEYSLVRYIAKYIASGDEAKARAVFRLGMRWSLVLAVVGAVAVVVFRGPLALRVFNDPRLLKALVLISLSVIPYSFMRTLSGALRGVKDIKSVTIGFEASDRVVRFVFFLLFYFLGMRLVGIVLATVVSTTASALILAYFLWRGSPMLFRKAPVEGSEIPRKEIVSYSGAMLADSLVGFSMQHSGRIVLGIFLVAADVGVFNMAALVANIITFVLLSFNMIFSPVIADLYHRDRSDLLQPLFRSVTRWTIILSLPVFLWIVVAGKTTLGVFGPEFVVGYDALVLFSIGLMISVVTGPVGVALAMTGYQKWNVLNAVVTAIVGVVLTVVLVPRMGIAGAGLAAGASNGLVKVARLFQVRYLLKLTPYDRSTLKVVVTVVVTTALAFLARRFAPLPPGIEWSALAMVVSAGVVTLMTIVMGIEAEDRLVLGTVLRKFRRVTGGE